MDSIFKKTFLDRIYRITFYYLQFPATGPQGLGPGGKKLEIFNRLRREISYPNFAMYENKTRVIY
jgi:hypothetical protein